MKIELDDVQATIDSLQDKAEIRQHKLVGYLVGSQPFLRARLYRYPEERNIIFALLKQKDMDIRYEPKDGESSNIAEIRAIYEEISSNLSKKSNQEITKKQKNWTKKHPSMNNKKLHIEHTLPATWQPYYSLPVDTVKGGVKKQLDPSVQFRNIEPSMNIDIKSDFQGIIKYSSEKHRHDFEVTYLEDNLIIYYDIDNIDLRDYKEQNKMAFRLRKTLKPEVTNFSTLLSGKSAALVKNLFESADHAAHKTAILNLMKSHYKMDMIETEKNLRNLYSDSLNHAIRGLTRLADNERFVIIENISILEENHLNLPHFTSELDEIDSSLSILSFESAENKLNALKELKAKTAKLCDVIIVDPSPKTSPLLVTKKEITVKSQVDTKPTNQPQDKKKKKSSPSIISQQSDLTDANLDTALNEAKVDYKNLPAVKITPNREFQSLIEKYSPAIKQFTPPAQAKNSNIWASNEMSCYKTMRDFMLKAINDKTLQMLLQDFNLFYKKTMAEVKAEVSQIPEKPEIIAEESLTVFERMDKIAGANRDKFLLINAIHSLLMGAYIDQDPNKYDIPKKVRDCVRNYKESKDPNIDILVKSILDNCTNDLDTALEKSLCLLNAAILNEINKKLYEPKISTSSLTQIARLLDLISRSATILSFHKIGDDLDIDLVNKISALLINGTTFSHSINNLFLHYFINQTIGTTFMLDEKTRKDHFSNIFAHSGILTVKHLFPLKAFAQIPAIVAATLCCFTRMIPQLKAFYYVLLLSTPLIKGDPNDLFSLYTLERIDNQVGSNVFAEAICARNLEELRDLVNETVNELKDVRLEYENTKHIHIKTSYDLVVLSTETLRDNIEILAEEHHHKKLHDLLKSNPEFIRLAKSLSARIAMETAPSSDQTDQTDQTDQNESMDAYIQIIIAKSNINFSNENDKDQLQSSCVKKCTFSYNASVNAKTENLSNSGNNIICKPT